MKEAHSQLIDQVTRLVRRKLQEFAQNNQSGIIAVDVTMSKGKPTAVNANTKEHFEVIEQRERFPV